MPFALSLPPTAKDVRLRIPPKYLTKQGFPAPEGGGEDPLESFCATAVGYVASTTGRPIDNTLLTNPQPTTFFEEWVEGFWTGGYDSELDLGLIGYRAVILRAVQELTHESAKYMTATIAQDYLAGFKAGSYTETRRDPETVLRSRGSVSNPLINPWRDLSDLLWLMLTADQFDYWMLRLGQPMPASIFVEQDFRDQWDMPGVIPGTLPGFGPPGLGGDFLWPGQAGGGEWG